MTAIVRIALSRPYTFVVMAILILIFGVQAAIRTPTDIFPNIGIPVISVVWSYTGLPPDDMAGRILSGYERSLSTTVNDIAHIEFEIASRSRDRQDLLSTQCRHQRRANAGHVDLANRPEANAARRHPADHSGIQCVERSNHSARPVERRALADAAGRSRAQFHSTATGDGRRRAAAVPLRRLHETSADRFGSACAARP